MESLVSFDGITGHTNIQFSGPRNWKAEVLLIAQTKSPLLYRTSEQIAIEFFPFSATNFNELSVRSGQISKSGNIQVNQSVKIQVNQSGNILVNQSGNIYSDQPIREHSGPPIMELITSHNLTHHLTKTRRLQWK